MQSRRGTSPRSKEVEKGRASWRKRMNIVPHMSHLVPDTGGGSKVSLYLYGGEKKVEDCSQEEMHMIYLQQSFVLYVFALLQTQDFPGPSRKVWGLVQLWRTLQAPRRCSMTAIKGSEGGYLYK